MASNRNWILISAVLLSYMIIPQTAFGNYYVGGYTYSFGPTSTGWHDEKVTGIGFFPTLQTGTDPLLNVFTTAGWNNKTGTLDGWAYQNLEYVSFSVSNYHVFTDPQVLNCNVISGGNCSEPFLGGSNVVDEGVASTVDHFYQQIVWINDAKGNRNHVNFQLNTYYNNGAMPDLRIFPYYVAPHNDPTTHFTSGIASINIGGTPTNFYLYQFGTESISNQPGWTVKQDTMAFTDSYDYGGTLNTFYLKNFIANAVQGSQSTATYVGSTTYRVGGSDMQADAHSEDHNNNQNLVAGVVKWFYSATPIGTGVQLWH